MAEGIVVSLTPKQVQMLVNQLFIKEVRIKQSKKLPDSVKRQRLTEIQQKINFFKNYF